MFREHIYEQDANEKITNKRRTVEDASVKTHQTIFMRFVRNYIHAVLSILMNLSTINVKIIPPIV